MRCTCMNLEPWAVPKLSSPPSTGHYPMNWLVGQLPPPGLVHPQPDLAGRLEGSSAHVRFAVPLKQPLDSSDSWPRVKMHHCLTKLLAASQSPIVIPAFVVRWVPMRLQFTSIVGSNQIDILTR